MEEKGYGKKGLLSSSSSSSSSSSWASRLSPLAQPFTMTRPPVGQPPALNSLTSSLNHKSFTPSPRNQLDPFDDPLLPNSLSDLTLSGQLLPVSSPTSYPSYSALQSDSVLSASGPTFPFDDPSEFGAEASFSQYPSGEFRGYFDSSSVLDETEFDALAFSKSSVFTYTQCSSHGEQGRAADGKNFAGLRKGGPWAGEDMLKQDSKLTSQKVSTTSDVQSLSMIQNVPQDPMLGSSANGTSFSPSSHILSKNVDLTGYTLTSNMKSSSDRGKEIMSAKSVPCKVLDPLVNAKSEGQFTPVDILDGSIMKRSGSLASISTKCSSKMLDEDGSDVDSPCWKGTQNSTKSSVIVSKSLSTHSLRNESEAGTSLNPRAPQFFPSHAKGSINYLQNNSVGGFPSLGEGECSTFDLSYNKKPLVDSCKAGSKTHGSSNFAGYQQSTGRNEPEKESVMLKNSKSSSTLVPSQIIKPHLLDGFFTSKGMPLKGVNVEGFADGIMDAVNTNPANPSALAAEYIPNLSSSGVCDLNDCSEILQCLTQSLSECPKTNVAIIVNAMRLLSDWLVQNCSNDLDSLNEHEHEMIRHIINNLYVLIHHRVKGKAPMLNLLHTGSPDYRDKSTVTVEQANTEFRVNPRTKDLVVREELESRNNHAWRKSYSHVPARKIQDLVPSSRDIGSSERGNSVIPVLRNALKENQRIDEEIHLQALLNLWLEAERALCSMKYENCILRRKLQMDGCKDQLR